jgi:hypothetical protein
MNKKTKTTHENGTKNSTTTTTMEVTQQKTSSHNTVPTALSKDRVHYKFNEGFSNAVKRTVYIKDFL